MEADKLIEKVVKNARKRLCKIKFYKGLLLFLIIGLSLWGLMQLISLIVPFYSATIIGIILCIVTLIVGIIITVVRYPSMKEAALKLDSKGFKERVTTSMELRGKKDIFSTMQKNDTLEKTAGISMRKIFPMKINKLLFLFLFLSSMFVLTTAMIPAKTKEIAIENTDKENNVFELSNVLEGTGKLNFSITMPEESTVVFYINDELVDDAIDSVTDETFKKTISVDQPCTVQLEIGNYKNNKIKINGKTVKFSKASWNEGSPAVMYFDIVGEAKTDDEEGTEEEDTIYSEEGIEDEE